MNVDDAYRMVRFNVDDVYYDFDDEQYHAVIQLPRLIHGSPANNIRLRKIRCILTPPLGTNLLNLTASTQSDSNQGTDTVDLEPWIREG